MYLLCARHCARHFTFSCPHSGFGEKSPLCSEETKSARSMWEWREVDTCPKRDKAWVADQKWVVREEIHLAGLGGFHVPEGQEAAVQEAEAISGQEKVPCDPGPKPPPYPSNPTTIS